MLKNVSSHRETREAQRQKYRMHLNSPNVNNNQIFPSYLGTPSKDAIV